MNLFAGKASKNGKAFGLLSISNDLLLDSGIELNNNNNVSSNFNINTRISNIVFDSRLIYLRILYSCAATFTIPATNASSSNSSYIITILTDVFLPSAVVTPLILTTTALGDAYTDFYEFNSAAARFFYVYYNPSTNTINCKVDESFGKNGSLPAKILTLNFNILGEV